MLRHHDIAQNDKSISPPYSFQYFEKQVKSRWHVQKRLSVVATEGKKVQFVSAESAVKLSSHRRRIAQLVSTVCDNETFL